MAELTAALVREQGVIFSVVAVKPHVLANRHEAEEAACSLAPHFPGAIVLMAQDGRGSPRYFGRPDIVRFLSGISLSRLPWKKYQLN